MTAINKQLYTETPRIRTKHKKEPGGETPPAKSKQETDSLVAFTRPMKRIKRLEFACIRPRRRRRHRRYRLVRSTRGQRLTRHQTGQREFRLKSGDERMRTYREGLGGRAEEDELGVDEV